MEGKLTINQQRKIKSKRVMWLNECQAREGEKGKDEERIYLSKREKGRKKTLVRNK